MFTTYKKVDSFTKADRILFMLDTNQNGWDIPNVTTSSVYNKTS